MGKESWRGKRTRRSITPQIVMLLRAGSAFRRVICHRTLLSTSSDGCSLSSGGRMPLALCAVRLATHQSPAESHRASSVTSPGRSKAVLKHCRLSLC